LASPPNLEQARLKLLPPCDAWRYAGTVAASVERVEREGEQKNKESEKRRQQRWERLSSRLAGDDRRRLLYRKVVASSSYCRATYSPLTQRVRVHSLCETVEKNAPSLLSSLHLIPITIRQLVPGDEDPLDVVFGDDGETDRASGGTVAVHGEGEGWVRGR
jgi:hypothetical protein